MPPRAHLHAALIIALALTLACTPLRRDGSVEPRRSLRVQDRATPSSKQATTPSAKPAFQYFYNRNAITASHLVGDHLIAVVEAGHILRFDADSFELTGELLSGAAALVLGAASGNEVSLGFEDGSISRLNADTLGQAPVGRVDGIPLFITEGPEETVVVHAKPGRQRGPYLRYRVLSEHKATWLESRRQVALWEATSFLDDGSERLWVGRGGMQVIDLRNAVVTHRGPVPTSGWPIGGLGKLSDGVASFWVEGTPTLASCDEKTMKAFCGCSSHELRTFIATLKANGQHQRLFSSKRYTDDSCLERPPSTGDHLQADLLAIAPDPSDGSVVLVSENAVYRSDARFARWKKLADVSLPRLLGQYAGLTAIHLRNSSLILATPRDGYTRVDLGTGESRAYRGPARLEISPFFLRAGGNEAVLLGTYWHAHQVALTPSGFMPAGQLLRAPPPRTPSERHYEHPGWSDFTYLPAPDGTLFIVAQWGDTKTWSSGGFKGRPTVVGLRESGISRILGEQATELSVGWMFVSPDGLLLASDAGAARLWVFDGGQWTGFDNKPTPIITKNLGRYGDRWFVLAGSHLATYRRGDRSLPTVELLPAAGWHSKKQGRNAPTGLTDALRWDAHHILIVAESGLCLYDLRSYQCTPLPLPEGMHAPPTRAVRDADGRFWLAGNGLWLLDGLDRARAFHEQMPLIEHAPVFGFALFQGDLLLALSERGLVRIDLDAL